MNQGLNGYYLTFRAKQFRQLIKSLNEFYITDFYDDLVVNVMTDLTHESNHFYNYDPIAFSVELKDLFVVYIYDNFVNKILNEDYIDFIRHLETGKLYYSFYLRESYLSIFGYEPYFYENGSFGIRKILQSGVNILYSEILKYDPGFNNTLITLFYEILGVLNINRPRTFSIVPVKRNEPILFAIF